VQALEALEELTYDVVITDLQMPGGGGSAVLDALIRHYPETARVVHSSQLESGDTFRCPGAHAILAKPASETEIMAALEEGLRRVASERKSAANG
jgi:DNA-binding NarL/FixJ family response regulator